VNPDFWHARWQQNQIGFHQQDINMHLQDFWPLPGVPEGGRVLVPLCGKSRDMLWLLSQGYGVLGVEVSPIAVQDFFRENDLQPTVTERGVFESWACDDLEILCGDFFQLATDDMAQVDAVFDRASLVALPPAMRVDYAAQITRLLAADIAVLLVSMEYPGHEMQGPPFSVIQQEVDALYGAAFNVELLASVDILKENDNLRSKGLTRMQEKVYQLTRMDS
jgi:thiopurine S-methyltransferase